MVKFNLFRRSKKIKSIKSIRQHFLNLKNQVSDAPPSISTAVTHREVLINLGLGKRYSKINSNNNKSTGTALTRLETLVKFFRVLNTRKAILRFFVNLCPSSIEKFANQLADKGKSPSTVYNTLIGFILYYI